jgi:hypothetical protein
MHKVQGQMEGAGGMKGVGSGGEGKRKGKRKVQGETERGKEETRYRARMKKERKSLGTRE